MVDIWPSNKYPAPQADSYRIGCWRQKMLQCKYQNVVAAGRGYIHVNPLPEVPPHWAHAINLSAMEWSHGPMHLGWAGVGPTQLCPLNL